LRRDVIAERTRRISLLPGRPRTYRLYHRKHIDSIPQLSGLSEFERNAMKAVAAVLPFRANDYVVEDLIDWDNIPLDPIFQLTFPQPAMLEVADFRRMYELVRREAPAETIQAAAREIQDRMNPHPSGQLDLNVPQLDGRPLPGAQHKYRETVLLFPAAGQTCHAYCTYCFRWAQFVGIDKLEYVKRDAAALHRYVADHPEITSILFTGGDPMFMRTSVLRRYVEPFLHPDLGHIESIRFGTKAPAYWPYRFTTDPDADDLLRLFETVRKSGRHVALMAHYSHPRELETGAAERAVRRIQSTGAVVRCQAPLIKHVNDSAGCWAQMWRRQVRLGAVPYYMFIERDTGPKNYFGVPLTRCLKIFNEACAQVSGLGRTARGPSMSAMPGKVLIDGRARIHGQEVFVLKFLQARDPQWVGRVFFARYDPRATWLDDLRPAFGEKEFFFEPSLRRMQRALA
jgi:L-lysine 2,3-aminomutase